MFHSLRGSVGCVGDKFPVLCDVESTQLRVTVLQICLYGGQKSRRSKNN